MADNRLRIKAMKNHWKQLGYYTGNEEEDINPSPENTKAATVQSPNYKRKTVRVGRSRRKIRGLMDG